MRASARRSTKVTVMVAALAAALLIPVSPAQAAAHDFTYEVTVTNLTDGQLLTPPLVATHRGGTRIFRPFTPASAALQSVAENGGVPDLVAHLAADPGVSGIAVGGDGPLAPGTEATFMVTGAPGSRFVSLAAMLICTNDGFAGVDRARLPNRVGQSVTYYGNAYDAGTEINTEDYDDLVPPCDGLGQTGMTNPALAENGVVHPHAGITGGADLVPGIHGWTNPVVELTITRVG